MSEPIFWLTTKQGDADKFRTMYRRDPDTGKMIIEKHPQHGHEGPYDGPRHKARGVRYIYYVRHEGHEIALVMTNAAAHLDHETSWGNYQRRKAQHFGWYAVGQCPVALIGAGQMERDKFMSPETRNGTACVPSVVATLSRFSLCPHDIAERAARKKAWDEVQRELAARYRSQAEEHLEELRKQNRLLTAKLERDIGGDSSELEMLRQQNEEQRDRLARLEEIVAKVSKKS